MVSTLPTRRVRKPSGKASVKCLVEISQESVRPTVQCLNRHHTFRGFVRLYDLLGKCYNSTHILGDYRRLCAAVYTSGYIEMMDGAPLALSCWIVAHFFSLRW